MSDWVRRVVVRLDEANDKAIAAAAVLAGVAASVFLAAALLLQ